MNRRVRGNVSALRADHTSMDHSNRNQIKGSGRRPDRGRVKPIIKARARQLRREMTDAERLLWRRLRSKQLGYGFRRQVPFGRYIVDFVCFDRRLVIEVDGGHHAEQVAYDTERTQWLESYGFRVLRFWNNDVLREIEGVLQAILAALRTPGAPCEQERPTTPPDTEPTV